MATTFSVPREVTVPLSPEEYLRTSYRPDCDYVDGQIEERNVGEFEHSRIQFFLTRIFGNHEQAWDVITAPECRLQMSASRFRVPDVMVLRRGTKISRIVRETPLLCIEVLSPEDTWSRLRARLNDYLALGVEHLWCFDPDAREVRTYTATGFEVVRTPELYIPGTPIRINLADVFAILDQD